MSNPIYLFSISTHPDTISINSLDITLLQPEIDFTKYDYIIATSKQVFQALLNYGDREYKNKKFLCISQATAKSCEELGCEVLEIGSGYGDDLSRVITQYPKSTKWLYLRAEIVASDFVKVSQEVGFSIEEVVVYKSECSSLIKSVLIPSKSILIFTSPSSVKCFYNSHPIDEKNKIVVIGKSTQKALPISLESSVAPSVSIDACVKLAKELNSL
jgi:uroporphyrinogen-III synthase